MSIRGVVEVHPVGHPVAYGPEWKLTGEVSKVCLVHGDRVEYEVSYF